MTGWVDDLTDAQAEAYADDCEARAAARAEARADALEQEADREKGRLADRWQAGGMLVIGALRFDLGPRPRCCGIHGDDTTSGRCPSCDLERVR